MTHSHVRAAIKMALIHYGHKHLSGRELDKMADEGTRDAR